MKIERKSSRGYKLIFENNTLISRDCTKCEQHKDITCFYINKHATLGFSVNCKECTKNCRKEFYAKNIDKIKSTVSEYRNKNHAAVKKKKVIYYKKVKNTSEFKEKQKVARNKWKSNNKHKVRASSSGRRNKQVRCSFGKKYNNQINEIYKDAMLQNKHVDHIIPINNKNITGLHVPWNLQILDKVDNLVKSNKWDGTYENESWRKDL